MVPSGATPASSISSRRSKHRRSVAATSPDESISSDLDPPMTPASSPAPDPIADSPLDADLFLWIEALVSSITRRDSASMSAPYVTTLPSSPSISIRRNVSNAFSSSPALAHALMSVVYAITSGWTPLSYIMTKAANALLESAAEAHTDSSML